MQLMASALLLTDVDYRALAYWPIAMLCQSALYHPISVQTLLMLIGVNKK